MHRRTSIAALVGVALLLGLFPGTTLAEKPSVAGSMAAVGDSITRAASTGGSLGVDYPQNSWSTGTSSTVDSHYLRLSALNPAIGGNAHNLAVSGAKMVDLQGQMEDVLALAPDYLTVLIGGNDICTDTEQQMTEVELFRDRFEAAMATLTAGSPNTNVYVISIPRVLGLWELFRGNWWARFVWSAGDICQSLLANPTSTQTADVERRARVAQRNVDYNLVLEEVCSLTPRCLWDGWAVYDTKFTTSDVSADYFHPSTAGQAKLARVTWDVGFWGAPPNQAPVARFTFSCADLACSFDGSTSTDGDGSVATYAWQFGDGAAATGATTSHAFGAAGTYPVTLTVTDDVGAPGSTTQGVTVTAPGPVGTVSLGSLAGSGATRKGGWTAMVTLSALDGNQQPVASATVSGHWSTGSSGSCTTGTTGSCTFTLNLGKKAKSVSWAISTITHATLAYRANALTGVTITSP